MVACVYEDAEPIVIGNNVCSYGEYECHDGNSYYCGYPDSSNDVMWIHAETCHNGCDSSTGKCYRNSGGSNNNESGNNSGNNNESGNNGSGNNGGGNNGGGNDSSECISGNFKCIGTESFYCNSLGSWVYDARCEYGCDSSTGKCKNNSNDISDSGDSSDSGNDHGDSSDSGSTSECTSGKYKCEGSYSYYCSNGYWDSGEYCSNGCNSSTGKCKSSSGDSNNGSGDCSDIYECLKQCSSDSCLQSCYDNGSSEGRNKLDKMYDCWHQYCDQYYDDDFENCIYAYCSNETYACIKSGGENYSECASVGGTWNSSTNKCTRTQSCSSKPANTVWNTVSSITQTYSGSSWSPSTTSSYNETGSTTECRYKCASGYKWNGSSCVSSGSSTLPKCSSSSGTPCRDSSSGLTWSARASNMMTWSSAKSYCENYTEGGLSGWHLPTIDELKTLLIWSKASSCKASETNNCLAWNECWTCETCTEQGTASTSNSTCSDWGTSWSDGRYSKFGDTGWFWSSSILSDYSINAWHVGFYYGDVGHNGVSYSDYVRCVR